MFPDKSLRMRLARAAKLWALLVVCFAIFTAVCR